MYKNIGILNFNIGNVKSIIQIIKKIDYRLNVIIINKKVDFNKIDYLILPGQGNILSCISYIFKFNLFDNYFYFIKNKPVLGICVSKHLFYKKSFENYFSLFSIFNGCVKNFKYLKFKGNFFKLPNINWLKLKIIKNHYLLKNISDLNYFYFSHNYYLFNKNYNNIYALNFYNNINFCSIYIKNNILLTQFHPEKSRFYGFKIFSNFFSWNLK